VKTFGPGDNQFGTSVSRLAGGHILVCGVFNNTITLGSKTLTSAGLFDVFVARFDGDGTMLSAARLGGTDSEGSPFATTSGSTAIIMGGSSSGEIAFPDGSHRTIFGTFDTYIFQQP
jgi:hypothetical protein